MNLSHLIVVIVGLLFVLSAFIALADYHLVGTDTIVEGTLYNFMLPTGWFSIIAGVFLLLLNRRNKLNKWLSLAIFAVMHLSDNSFPITETLNYFIGLWLGINRRL
jgi:peptidoglycan/LPS O-acetylase OafA/YrhL